MTENGNKFWIYAEKFNLHKCHISRITKEILKFKLLGTGITLHTQISKHYDFYILIVGCACVCDDNIFLLEILGIFQLFI